MGTPPLISIYISGFMFFSILQSLANLGVSFGYLIATFKYSNCFTYVCESRHEAEEVQKYIKKHVTKLVRFFRPFCLVDIQHSIIAFIWGLASFLLAVLLRPFFWNYFLFGNYEPPQLKKYLEEEKHNKKND